MIISNGDGANKLPKCIFCGKVDNIFRTGKYDTFYCKNCDTTFEPIELPKCPKCKNNDKVTTGHTGRTPWLRPVGISQFQYWCDRCEYFFSDETLLYNELSDMGIEYDEEVGGSNYSDDFENFEDFSGDDNPND